MLTDTLINEITGIIFEYPEACSLRPCDLIFVFGGTHPGLWEKAIEAYAKKLGKTILIAGGTNPVSRQHPERRHPEWKYGNLPESIGIKKELVTRGIPETDIICEDRSTNSRENVLLSAELFDFSNISNILTICKSYSIGRQCRTLRHNISAPVNIIPYTFDSTIGNIPTIITSANWMNYDHSKKSVIQEAKNTYVYGKTGHIQPLGTISKELERYFQEQIK